MIYNDLNFVLNHWHYDVFSIVEEKQDMVVSFEGKKFTFCNVASGEIGELMVPFEPSADDIVFKKRVEEKLSAKSYLKRFTGTYAIHGYTVEIILRDHKLIAIVPGQPNYDLSPTTENEFNIPAMTGASVKFIMDEDNEVKEVLLLYPYGAFTAVRKKIITKLPSKFFCTNFEGNLIEI